MIVCNDSQYPLETFPDVFQATANIFQGTAAYHICSIDRRGHLDFPEVLAVCELLGAADGSCAAAVVRVKAHLPVVTAEEGSGGLEVIIPHPVKT